MSAPELSPMAVFDQYAQERQLGLSDRCVGSNVLRWFVCMRESSVTHCVAVRQAFLIANLSPSGLRLDHPLISTKLARALLEVVAHFEPEQYADWREAALTRRMDWLELTNPHVRKIRAASRGILPSA